MDLGKKLGEKKLKFLNVDDYLQIQSVFHNDSTASHRCFVVVVEMTWKQC